MKKFLIKRDIDVKEVIKKLEMELKEYLGCEYALLMPSGTTAIYIALSTILEDKYKSEVLLPSLVCKTVPYAVKEAGKELNFLEIKPSTFNIDENLIEDKINNKTGAILVVHQFGMPCNMSAIKQIAEDNKLLIIEDAAQALGAEYKEEKVGTLGDIGVLSFNNKVIDACGGGAVITNNRDYFLKMKKYANDNFSIDWQIKSFLRGMVRSWSLSEHPKVGFTIGEICHSPMKLDISKKMNLITPFFLQDLLPKIDFILEQRRKNFELYNEYLRDDIIQKPYHEKDVNPACTFYTVRFENKTIRDKTKLELYKKGIHTVILANPTHHIFEPNSRFPITDQVAQTMLSFPTDPHLNEIKIKLISNMLGDIVNSCDDLRLFQLQGDKI
jgi:dTDP-4-amino-4,6-dideoxygalactose transaminase